MFPRSDGERRCLSRSEEASFIAMLSGSGGAALNIGTRPTVAAAQPQLRVEAHVLDFSGELYGAELELELGAKLRDERKFASATELREQISRDVAAVRAAV